MQPFNTSKNRDTRNLSTDSWASSAKHTSSCSPAEAHSHVSQSDAVVDLSPEAVEQLIEELYMLDTDLILPEHDGHNEYNSTHQVANDLTISLPDLPLEPRRRKEPTSKQSSNSIVVKSDASKRMSSSVPRLKLSIKKVYDKEADAMWVPPEPKPWMIEKAKLREKYPDGYQPLKKLSPDAMEGIRALHAQMPQKFTTAALAKEFKISPEAIRRILRSRWQPNTEEELDRERRWFKRGEKVWGRWADLGVTPSSKWQRLGIGAKRKKVMRMVDYQIASDPPPQLITTATRPVRLQREDGDIDNGLL